MKRALLLLAVVALAAGCVSVLVKPVSTSELLATVDPLLAQRG